MVHLTDLWLPVLASAAGVFVVSSVVHMVFRYHNHDWGRLPDEDRMLGAIRDAGVPQGAYRFPFAESMQEMGTAEMTAKFERGPVGFLQIMPPGKCAVGKSLVQWFVFTAVISAVIGYVTGLALAPAAGAMDVFRIAATTACLAYAIAPVTDSIWKGVRWGVSLRYILDGILYSLATGAVFAALWPAQS